VNPRFDTGVIFAMTEPLNIYGDLVWVKLAGDETAGRCAIMEIRTAPGGGPPLHRHNNEDEWFYVLEGEYMFEVDGARIRATAGASLLARRGTAHAFENTGAAPGRLLVVSEPAGLDEFFRDLAGAAAGGNTPDMALALPVFHKHGLELLGPPLAA
jgi:quercetin dioxygenase-like cupin family protein